MARTLTNPTQLESQKTSGVEPSVVVEIEWGDGVRYYGDKTTYIGSLSVEGRIVSISPLSFSVGVDDLGSSSVVTVSLSDNDLVLQTLLKSQRIENRTAKVYHHFEGLAEADLVTVLRGVVTSPIAWDENRRTLTFSIEGTVNSQTVGYRPAEGDFANLHEDGVGRVWPVCFGTPVDVPAALVKRASKGKLATDLGMLDTTFDVIDGDLFTQGSTITLLVGDELISGVFSGALDGVRTFTIVARNLVRYATQYFADRPIADPDADDSHFAWVPDEGKRYVGLWCLIDPSDVPGSTIAKKNFCIAQEGTKLRFQHPWGNGLTSDWELVGTDNGDWSAYYDDDQYRIIKAGSPVTEWGESEDVYVCNEITSSTVLRVSAFKTVQYNAVGAEYRALVDVPAAYYVVNLADSGLGAPGGRTPTTLTFETRLSERGSWEDDVIYVSLTSSQGENTADIIEWLLDNYTDLTPDATTFAAVNLLVENYPSHFAIISESDALRAAAEIAWQARCGLFTVGQSAYIRYLSKEPDAGDSDIILDDANDNTLEDAATLEFTDLDDVVTVFNALWRPVFSEDVKVKPYEENVSELGHRERDFDFYIYQDEDLVDKSASFWAARYARVWRLARVPSFLDALGLDVLDSVLLSLTDLDLPTEPTVVKEVLHDTSQHVITLLLWLPVEAGTVVESSAAWVDDTGDVKPADPSVSITPGPTEIESVPPTQFNFPVAISQASLTVPAKVDGAEISPGVYKAVTYPSGFSESPTDTIILNQVGDTDLEDEDEIMASQQEDGSWFGSKGGGGDASVKVGQITAGSGVGPYTVRVYDNGIDQAYTDTVSAYPLQIAIGYSFPTGMWVMLVYVSGATKWYFQGPIWVDDTP